MSARSTFIFAFNLLVVNLSLRQALTETSGTTTTVLPTVTFNPDNATTHRLTNGPDERRIFVIEPKPILREELVIMETRISPIQLSGNFSFLRLTSWADHVCGKKGLCDREKGRWACPTEFAVCHPCQCDKDCFQYGDCCLDAYPSDDVQITAHNLSCVTAGVNDFSPTPAKMYFMVTTCLDPGSPGSSGCELRIRDGPVYSPQTDLHYLNKHCALCNGISDYVVWRSQRTCLGFVNYTSIISLESFIEHALRNPSCDLHFVPPENSSLRECSHDGYNMVSSCPSGALPDEDRIYCERYFSPVTLRRTTYRNIFCAACHGVPFEREVNACSLGPFVTTGLTPLSRLTMDKRTQADDSVNTTSGEMVCGQSEVFDPYQGSCRPLFCPAGKVVRNHNCVDIFSSAFSLGYKLSFKLVPVEPAIFEDVVPIAIISAFEDHWGHMMDMTGVEMESTEMVLEHVSRPTYFDINNAQGRIEVLGITVTSFVVVTEHMPREKMENILKDFVLGGWHINNEDRLVAFQPTWIPGNNNVLRQANHSPLVYSNGNTTFTILTSKQHHFGPALPAYINEPSAYITVNEMMQCKMIQLNSSEYEGDTQTGVRYLGKILRYGQFVPADGDNIRVCSDFSGKRTSSSEAFTSDNEKGGKALSPAVTPSMSFWTVACFIVSLIFLLVALLLSALGRSVCLPDSLCKIVFMSNLLCGQVLFLVGSAIKLASVTCSVLGVVIHYSWLSASFWGLLAAIRLNQTPTNFPAGTKKRICQPSFWGIGQGTSALVVVVTIAAHLLSTIGSSHLAIGYGETLITHSRACFLTSQLGRILGFLVPAGLALLLTLILSAKTAFVNRGGITGDPAKSQLAIMSMKTSLILLLTWAVGVSALETDDKYLWLFFALLNAGVGLFVCVAVVEREIGCRMKAQRYVPRENSEDGFDSFDIKPNLNQVATITGSGNII